jgi:hypothetical protein
VYLYEIGGQQAFRQALHRYYDLHDDRLARRAGPGGTHLSKLPLSSVSNPADFHFAWHDSGKTAYFVEYGWADADAAYGIQSHIYECPQSLWRRLRPAFSGTTHTTFDNGTPGTLIPSGTVTYANGRAYLAPGASLRIPGSFPTSQPENLVAEFTVYNLAEVLPLGGNFQFGWYCPIPTYGFNAGFEKSPATGNVLKAGAFQYSSSYSSNGMHFGEAVSHWGSQKATVKMVVASTQSVNADEVTYVYTGYDNNARNGTTPGNLHLAGKYYRGRWTNQVSSVYLKNDTTVTLVIDDVIVSRYSGPVPAGSYSDYYNQMLEDANMGVIAAQAGMVSGVLRSSGQYFFDLGPIVWSDLYQPLMMNLDPGAHPASWPSWPTYHQNIWASLSETLGWNGTPTKMQGFFYDSIDWGFYPNYSQEHWQVSSSPLTFDRSNGNNVCLNNIFAITEHARQIYDKLCERGQFMNANSAFGSTTATWGNYMDWYFMPYIDIGGKESGFYNSSGSFAPPSHDQFLHWRALAARRPYWVMWNDNYSNGADINKVMELCMFYGMFPTMFHAHDGTNIWYFASSTHYNRDRNLFKTYVPIIKKIDLAGWQPVTYAAVNDPAVLIERFGQGDNLYLSLYNTSSSQTKTVQIALQRHALGLLDGHIVAEPQVDTGLPVALVSGDITEPVLSLSIGPNDCRVLKILSYEPGAFPIPPTISTVEPDPDTDAYAGTEYVKQLEATGDTPMAWSLLQSPSGMQIDSASGLLTWTPTACQADAAATVEVQAQNDAGTDTETWQVTPKSFYLDDNMVTLDDLLWMAEEWLQSGSGLFADLDCSGRTDLGDLTALSALWLVDFTPVVLQVENVNRSGYEVSNYNLQPGEKLYVDRNFVYLTGPAALADKTFIKTKNDDKQSAGDSFLTFTINKDCTVYVVHDDLVSPKPSWLSEFTDTNENVTADNNPGIFSLYRKDFPAGMVTLGGNRVTESSSISMYTVIIVEK